MDEINLREMSFLDKVIYLRSEGRWNKQKSLWVAFDWAESPEGNSLWRSVSDGDLTEFNRRFKPEDYTHIDLVCSLPPEILQEMAKEQELQGNRADLMIFAKNITAGKRGGGFGWGSSEKGFNYWSKILYHNFFEKPTQSSPASSAPEKNPERVYIYVRGKSKTFKPFVTISKIKSL